MSAKALPRRRLGLGFWTFIAFMLALTALFVGLGVWQVNRLAWKEQLIAEVGERLAQPPYDLPGVDDWPTLRTDTYSFHPVKLKGQYEPEKTVLVFTSLSAPKGKYDGPGYWVMTPLAVDGGGTAFINRGFVPQQNSSAFANGGAVPAGEITVTGVALEPEAAGSFTPGPDKTNHVEWVRDPARLAAMAQIEGPVLGFTIDVPAGDPGALPQGGETTVEFPNNHFGYALTWFGFALLTPALLAFWIWRQIRPRPV